MTSSKKCSSGSNGSNLGGFKILGCAGIFALLVACGRPNPGGYLKGNTMGTSYTVSYGPTTSSHGALQAQIDDLLNTFEGQLSNWRADSWVSQFNVAPANHPVTVPDHAYQVLRLCLDLAERSQGAFDPTVTPLVELWGFGTHRAEIVPSITAVESVRKHVGYEQLVLDSSRRTLLKKSAELKLNCSALAKGYAVDLVAQLLRDEHVDDFLINIGGELFAQGKSNNGSAWKIAISPPPVKAQQLHPPPARFELINRAAATSGHTQRVFISHGRRYSHIIDPRTGYPVATPIASATILAPTCALADGLATLALILNEAEITELLMDFPSTELIKTPWPAD